MENSHPLWTSFQGQGRIFTLDNRLLTRKIGSLAPVDQRRVSGALKSHLA